MKEQLSILITDNKFEEALDLLQSNNISFNDPDFGYSYAIIYFNLKDYINAAKIAEYISSQQDSIYYQEANLLVGFIYKEMKKWDKSKESFISFLNTFPKSPNAIQAGFLAGLCIEETEKYEEAVSHYSDLYNNYTNINNISDEILFRWAFCLDKLEEWTLARERYIELIKLYPEHTRLKEIYFLIGMTYLKQNSFNKAKEYFEKAAEIESNSPTFLNEIAKELCNVSSKRSDELKKVRRSYDPYS